jgi:hypothetical protein
MNQQIIHFNYYISFCCCCLLLLLSGVNSTNELELKIIGAGWGRTGTSSLKAALDELGYNTYHMDEVMKDVYKITPRWSHIFSTPKEDHNRRKELLREVLQGFNATVDYPAVSFFDEQLEMFPNAKVILSTRDFDSWYRSASNTIFSLDPRNENSPFGMKLYRNLFPPGIQLRKLREGLDIFPFPVSKKELVHKAYDEWVEHVRQTVKKSGQLLEIRVGKDGWKPLCEFLKITSDKCPISPFPHVNDESVLRGLIVIQVRIGCAWTIFLVLISLFLFWYLFLKRDVRHIGVNKDIITTTTTTNNKKKKD